MQAVWRPYHVQWLHILKQFDLDLVVSFNYIILSRDVNIVLTIIIFNIWTNCKHFKTNTTCLRGVKDCHVACYIPETRVRWETTSNWPLVYVESWHILNKYTVVSRVCSGQYKAGCHGHGLRVIRFKCLILAHIHSLI